jgi:5-methylthioadenosine/S-adenosylhomocysteine deaminase
MQKVDGSSPFIRFTKTPQLLDTALHWEERVATTTQRPRSVTETRARVHSLRHAGALAGALAVLLLLATSASPAVSAVQPWTPLGGILIRGATVVTMDSQHNIIRDGSVLVRRGKIVAVWDGVEQPPGVFIGNASVIEADSEDLVFPGLINLHNHLYWNHLHAWPVPSTHAIPEEGKDGTDPYANRYQWGGGGDPFGFKPSEYRRLVGYPSSVLVESWGLDLGGEVQKYAETAALLGGETTIQGGDDKNKEARRILVRNVEYGFGGRIRSLPGGTPIDKYVEEPDPSDPTQNSKADDLLDDMANGDVDTWLAHVAEGVPDGHRRPLDSFSSRQEFATLASTCMDSDASKCLLNDTTVVVHGTGLEREDFAMMRDAGNIRVDGSGDGRGAKLVWSPLSNMLLYGETARVYAALAEDVLVSLGTDWSPSGSRSLLRELKVADVALRDARVLGNDRELVPAFALEGKSPEEQEAAENALDRALVDMVTRNPALTARIYDRLGSIEVGKDADLLLVRGRAGANTVYRDLIDSHEEDLDLVLVGGNPLAGDVGLMAALKPGDHEVITGAGGHFERAVDVTSTDPLTDEGNETLAQFTAELEVALDALGGDNPPVGGGPGPPGNTYSYLQANVDDGKSADSARKFQLWLEDHLEFLRDGALNIERIQLAPLLPADDDFFRHLLRGELDANGLVADPTPPFGLYPTNLNHVGQSGNPFASLP